MAPKKARVVEIDDRLTDLFYSRRNKPVEEGDESEHTSVQPFGDNSWLLEFQSQTSMAPQATPGHATQETNSIISLNLSEVRPFWALEDRKSMISLWRRSKAWLAKDCQKQRKAALRKTSTK
jgi:hypothetical protein